MAKATEEKLSELHGVVATVLKDQLSETVIIADEDTGETKEIYTAAPATLAQAIKFLKDNDITASVEDDQNLNDLQELLRKKQTNREGRGLRLAGGTEHE